MQSISAEKKPVEHVGEGEGVVVSSLVPKIGRVQIGKRPRDSSSADVSDRPLEVGGSLDTGWLGVAQRYLGHGVIISDERSPGTRVFIIPEDQITLTSGARAISQINFGERREITKTESKEGLKAALNLSIMKVFTVDGEGSTQSSTQNVHKSSTRKHTFTATYERYKRATWLNASLSYFDPAAENPVGFGSGYITSVDMTVGFTLTFSMEISKATITALSTRLAAGNLSVDESYTRALLNLQLSGETTGESKATHEQRAHAINISCTTKGFSYAHVTTIHSFEELDAFISELESKTEDALGLRGDPHVEITGQQPYTKGAIPEPIRELVHYRNSAGARWRELQGMIVNPAIANCLRVLPRGAQDQLRELSQSVTAGIATGLEGEYDACKKIFLALLDQILLLDQLALGEAHGKQMLRIEGDYVSLMTHARVADQSFLALTPDPAQAARMWLEQEDALFLLEGRAAYLCCAHPTGKKLFVTPGHDKEGNLLLVAVEDKAVALPWILTKNASGDYELKVEKSGHQYAWVVLDKKLRYQDKSRSSSYNVEFQEVENTAEYIRGIKGVLSGAHTASAFPAVPDVVGEDTDLKMESELALIDGYRRNTWGRKLDTSFQEVEKVEGQELTLFIGKTKAGKSTSINYMMGYNFRLEYDEDEAEDKLIMLANPALPKPAKMGENPAASETEYPAIYPGRDGRFLCDCAGFGDSGGTDSAVMALINVCLLIKMSRVKKIVVTIDKDSMSVDAGQGFRDLLEILRCLFSDLSSERVRNSLILLVTKEPRLSEVGFRRKIDQHIVAQQAKLRKLLSDGILASAKTRASGMLSSFAGLFWDPSVGDASSILEELERDPEKIHKLEKIIKAHPEKGAKLETIKKTLMMLSLIQGREDYKMPVVIPNLTTPKTRTELETFCREGEVLEPDDFSFNLQFNDVASFKTKLIDLMSQVIRAMSVLKAKDLRISDVEKRIKEIEDDIQVVNQYLTDSDADALIDENIKLLGSQIAGYDRVLATTRGSIGLLEVELARLNSDDSVKYREFKDDEDRMSAWWSLTGIGAFFLLGSYSSTTFHYDAAKHGGIPYKEVKQSALDGSAGRPGDWSSEKHSADRLMYSVHYESKLREKGNGLLQVMVRSRMHPDHIARIALINDVDLPPLKQKESEIEQQRAQAQLELDRKKAQKVFFKTTLGEQQRKKESLERELVTLKKEILKLREERGEYGSVLAEDKIFFARISRIASLLSFPGEGVIKSYQESWDYFQESVGTATAGVHYPKRPRTVKQVPKSYEAQDTHWYTHDEIDTLLNHYCGGRDDVRIIAPLAAEQEEGGTLGENLNEARIQGVIQESYGLEAVTTTLVPINLGGNHWVALYIHNSSDGGNPVVGYFDPFGAGDIPDEIVRAVASVYPGITRESFLVSPIRLQEDGYNCGPWIISILRTLVATDGAHIPPEGYDIEAFRRKNQAILRGEAAAAADSRDVPGMGESTTFRHVGSTFGMPPPPVGFSYGAGQSEFTGGK